MAFISTKNLKGDIFGGITAGIVALPLALAALTIPPRALWERWQA